MKQPTVFVFDLETMGLVANDPILCISWKTFRSKTIHFRAAWEYPATWEAFQKAKSMHDLAKAFQNLDKPIMEDIFDTFKEADCLVGHFENYFDIPFVKTRLLKHRVGFLPKSIQTDTWRIARNHLKLRSNRLNAINEFFGLVNKHKQKDLSLWHAVMADNEFAKREMEKYNRRDVVATEAQLKRVIGYAKMPLAPQAKLVCIQPNCGGKLGHSEGVRNTSTGSYQRRCCAKCGTWAKLLVKKEEARIEQG